MDKDSIESLAELYRRAREACRTIATERRRCYSRYSDLEEPEKKAGRACDHVQALLGDWAMGRSDIDQGGYVEQGVVELERVAARISEGKSIVPVGRVVSTGVRAGPEVLAAARQETLAGGPAVKVYGKWLNENSEEFKLQVDRWAVEAGLPEPEEIDGETNHYGMTADGVFTRWEED